MLEKKNTQKKLPTHPLPFPTPTKIEWSVPKWIQKQIVEYDIKSECPEEYSTVDKVGNEKPLGSKSCFASRVNHLLISFLISKQARLNRDIKSVVVCINFFGSKDRWMFTKGWSEETWASSL